jgi:hypothetical protein
MERGDTAMGAGWMSRMQRLLVGESEAAEHGYPLYFAIFALLGRGNFDAALVTARRMQDIGRRFDDPNLVAIGLVGEGRVLIKRAR